MISLTSSVFGVLYMGFGHRSTFGHGMFGDFVVDGYVFRQDLQLKFADFCKLRTNILQ